MVSGARHVRAHGTRVATDAAPTGEALDDVEEALVVEQEDQLVVQGVIREPQGVHRRVNLGVDALDERRARNRIPEMSRERGSDESWQPHPVPAGERPAGPADLAPRRDRHAARRNLHEEVAVTHH